MRSDSTIPADARRRRLVRAYLVVASISLLATPGGAEARVAHGCARNHVAATVNHHHVCFSPHVPRSERSLDGYLTSIGRGKTSRALPKRLQRLALPDLQPIVARLLAAMPLGPTAPGQPAPWPATVATATRSPEPARAASADPAPTGTPTQITGEPPGGFDTSGLWFPPPGAAVGAPAGTTMVAEAQPYPHADGPSFGGKLRTQLTDRQGGSEGIDTNNGGALSCPDRQGLSPGDAQVAETKFKQFTAKQGTAWWRSTQSSDGRILARTDDQAHVTDFDLDATLRVQVSGATPQTGQQIPLDEVARVALRHVPVGNPLGILQGQYISSFTAGGTGLSQKDMETQAFVMLFQLVSKADEMLKAASNGGWDGCLSIVFSPPAQAFHASETHTIEALVDSLRTGVKTVAMDMQATAPASYTVSPSHDVQGMGTPASFMLKAPAMTPKSSDSLYVEGVGKQGKVSGRMTPSFVPDLSRMWDVEFSGTGQFRRDQITYNSDGTVATETVSTGSPTWDTTSDDLLVAMPASGWSSAVAATEQVSGPATVTTDGNACNTNIVDPSSSTGSRAFWQVDADGSLEMIVAPAYSLAGNGPLNDPGCGFSMGILNPGGQLTPGTGAGFSPTEATQVYLKIPKYQLDATGNGGQLAFDVTGPASPITLNSDCGSGGNYSCTQSLTWHGVVTLTRHSS